MDYPASVESTLRELFRSLDERWRPEDVAKRVASLLDLSVSEQRTLDIATRAGQGEIWFSMSTDFQRPVDMDRQLSVAEQLFESPVNFSPDDVMAIRQWIETAESTIGKRFGHSDFKYDRLPKAERLKAGIDISRRQYNKKFRFAARLERKVARLAREQFKRSLTLASNNRLAARISWDDFSADMNTACFIAYYVSRCNLRSLFTNTSQTRPYDEICDVLMRRCDDNHMNANWWAIAHALPMKEVLKHLDDEQKGVLLADYFSLMNDAAQFLKSLWDSNDISSDMIVKRGNDSTTWNITAGAWNKLRDGWFSLMYDLGLTSAVEQMCPGKVLRLMAGDVAAWHQSCGGDLHPDTSVWQELPRPWDVLSGELPCSKSLVDEKCKKYGIDPIQSGWSAPRPGRQIEKFSPTPELVHGVVVGSPLLASILRKTGVFSGKSSKDVVPMATVEEIRSRHYYEQERKRLNQDIQK